MERKSEGKRKNVKPKFCESRIRNLAACILVAIPLVTFSPLHPQPAAQSQAKAGPDQFVIGRWPARQIRLAANHCPAGDRLRAHPLQAGHAGGREYGQEGPDQVPRLPEIRGRPNLQNHRQSSRRGNLHQAAVGEALRPADRLITQQACQPGTSGPRAVALKYLDGDPDAPLRLVGTEYGNGTFFDWTDHDDLLVAVKENRKCPLTLMTTEGKAFRTLATRERLNDEFGRGANYRRYGHW